MKELSVKEKAKRYDEVVEKFDVILNLNTVKESGTIFTDDVIKILPELKESKDERIRKWLICTLKSLNNSPVQIDGAYEMMLPAIAWLEKQGKKETDEWKEGNIIRHGGILALVIKGRRAMKSNGEIFTVQYPDEWVKAVPNEIKCFLNELEKQGEQKPAWSEDDERISSNINLYISKAGDYPHFGKENIKEAKNWMNALKDRVQPQPKQEWSEEDETVLDNLIYALANDRIGNDRDEYVTWLKSLKDRVGCEVNCITTKEWSEKDGSRIDNLCHFLEEYGNQYYGHLTLQGTISWLKSLKPQNTWKPSEYELKVLKLAAEKDGACLMGLYQQLKKLRGE